MGSRAEPTRAGRRPRPSFPALDEPTVETAGGLRFYRRPPLQSVAGPEVGVPPGARETEPPTDPRIAHLRDRVAAALDTTTTEEVTHG